MTKILQTGDIHVGECRSLDNYLQRHKSVLDEITGLAKKINGPLIISGDIFHTKTVSNEEKFLIDYWLSSLEKNKINTIIISGNHDHLYGEITHLDGYLHFPWNYLNVVATKPKLIKIDNVAFICIPWGNYSEGQLYEIVNNLRLEASSCKYVVVVCHECLFGSVFDNGVAAKKGHKLPKIDWVTYWAVGDIHKPQNAGLPNAFYAGAPLQYKFSDEQNKGVLEVDLDNPCNPNFIPLKSKKMIIVNNLEDIVDNGENFYMVKAKNENELISAHKYASVIKTNWTNTENIETISLENDDIFIGFSDFLREKGFSEDEIDAAKEVVNNLKG
jgi:DNA repair exonuclease SbcCD nuclease subunit